VTDRDSDADIFFNGMSPAMVSRNAALKIDGERKSKQKKTKDWVLFSFHFKMKLIECRSEK
jgi:hypothetical protein